MSYTRAEWALALITELKYVEGVTRLHKYAFLAAKRIKDLANMGFYDDWEASNYGPFSKTLANDIQGLIEDGLIKERVVPNKYGYKVSILEPTEAGKARIEDRKELYARLFNEIRKLLEPYQKRRLMDVLHDVYYLYPQYAVKSKIRAEVGRQIYESDSFLNPEYD